MKVYFDKSIIGTNPWVVFLNPILGKYNNNIWGYDEDQIIERTEKGKEFIEFSDIKECDFVVFPKNFKLDYFDELKNISKIAKQYDKKVIVFYISDVDTEIKIENILVFRTSITNKNPKNEYCMPSFPGDTLKKYCNGKIKFKNPSKEISVGYSGYSGFYNFKTFVFYLFLQIARNIMKIGFVKKFVYNLHREKIYHLLSTIGIGKYIRSRVVKQFKKLNKIKFNFIGRKGGLYLDVAENIKTEYINNIIESDFALVMRGNGNYSFRLYEIMSLGKIPIFVDTECRLPFDNTIDYKKLFIILPFSHINEAEKYIDKFLLHNRLNINNIQENIRNIYASYFTVTSFYVRMAHFLNYYYNNKQG